MIRVHNGSSAAPNAISATNATDAQFREWINEFHNSMLAAGWVQTADTGQINFATATRPTVANQGAGCAIYRMADTLQATAPVFMRVDFCGGASSNYPTFQIQFGTSTNGASALTGLKSDWVMFGSSNFSAGLDWYFSGDTSRFSMIVFAGSSQPYTTAFSVERMKDGNGADTGEGIIIMGKAPAVWPQSASGWYNSEQCFFQAFRFGAGVVQGDTAPISFHDGAPVFFPQQGNTGGSNNINSNSAPQTWRIPSSRGIENDPIGLLSYMITQIAGYGTEFDISIYGASHHYKCITTVGNCGFMGQAATPWSISRSVVTSALALRWE